MSPAMREGYRTDRILAAVAPVQLMVRLPASRTV